MSVSAFVLIDVTGDHTKSAFKTITRLQGVKELYPITGPYDLIAHIEAETIEEMNDLVLSKIRGVDGITKTNTALVMKI